MPQEYILSLLLLNFYIKSLPVIIQSFGVGCHHNGDDIQLYISPYNFLEAAVKVNTRGWSQLAESKQTEAYFRQDGGDASWEGRVLQAGSDLPALYLIKLSLEHKVKSLGVLLDLALLMDVQVSTVGQSAFFQLRLAYQTASYLGSTDLAMLMHTTVTSRLNQANAVYVRLLLKMSQKVQLLKTGSKQCSL